MVPTLPTGTVTFLFTDIEGSTRLAQRFGADYPQLIADHFAIIRGEVDQAGGVEVNTTGDGVFAVFASPVGALGAADAERETMGAGWGPRTIGSYNANTLLVEQVGEERAKEMIEPGRLMDLAEAVELALATLSRPG